MELCTQREAECQKRTPNFQFEASRKKFRGQYNFFSVLPFCHYNCQSAIAFLDAQMHKRYDIGRWGQSSLRSLKGIIKEREGKIKRMEMEGITEERGERRR